MNDKQNSSGTLKQIHANICVNTDGNKIAIVDSNEKSIAYNEFYEATERMSHYLTYELGFKQKERIGIVAGWNLDEIVTCFAALNAGLSLVLQNPRYPQQKINEAFGSVNGIRVISKSDLPDIEELILNKKFKTDSQVNNYIAPSDETFVLFSSGSTGLPKPVINTHKTTYGNMVNAPIHDKNGVFLTTSPYCHILGNLIINTAFYDGATLVLADTLNPDKIAKLSKKYKATTVIGAPRMFEGLIDKDINEKGTLRRAFSGGQIIPKDICNKFYAATGIHLINAYGSTECIFHGCTEGCLK